MRKLEKRVHICRHCYQIDPRIEKYYPVYSFGDLEGKPIWVVAINPSHAEYDGKNGGAPYLSRSIDIEKRSRNQVDYFCSGHYNSFFFRQVERLFDEEVQRIVVAWEKKPWEKVGFVDLVKCVTKDGWSKLKPEDQQTLVGNCESYLKEQLVIYRPKLVVTYGKPVREWFSRFSGQYRNEYEYARVPIQAEYGPAVSFIDQRGYKRSEQEIAPIRQSIVNAFKLLGSPRL